MTFQSLKQFGQNFLTDTSIADAIIQAAAITAGEPVWEIGPGTGILTERILQLTDNLTAFEIDHRLNKLLHDKYGNRLNLINRDILACDWPAQLAESIGASGQKVKLISNLPYQITSPILYAIEENEQWFSSAIIMIQKEVAERLTAKPGSKAYGVLTLKIRYAFQVETILQVPPTAFEPRPKVNSTVVRLTPRIDKPALKSLDTYRQIIHTAFAQRRKTLRNNLRGMFAPDILSNLEKQCGINFNRRGETLAEGEFVCLADDAFELSGH